MYRTATSQAGEPSVAFVLRNDDPARLVEARLRRSGYPFLRSVKCNFDDGEGTATLLGSVPTYHLKQIAQELACHTPGVRRIENRLHVTGPTHQPGRPAAAGVTQARKVGRAMVDF